MDDQHRFPERADNDSDAHGASSYEIEKFDSSFEHPEPVGAETQNNIGVETFLLGDDCTGVRAVVHLRNFREAVMPRD